MLFICFVVTSHASSIPCNVTPSMHSDYLQDDSMSLNYNNITINDHPSISMESHTLSASACPINILSCTNKSNGDSSTRQIESQQRLHEEKFHKCSTCDQSFSQKCRLKIHQCGHTGEKPYKCATCDKCFTWKGDLDIHHRIHTGDKPYQCSTCDKCFSMKKYLNKHKYTHTSQKLI